MQHFGKIIRRMIDAKGLSQRQFAERAELSKVGLWHLLQYERADECRPSTRQALARGFGMEYDAFLEFVRREQASQSPPPYVAGVPHTTLDDLPRFLAWYRGLAEDDQRVVLGALGEAALRVDLKTLKDRGREKMKRLGRVARPKSA